MLQIDYTHMPHTIITLPPELANQIAAGEVVERPASVVKELIENSIDAGATMINITIKNGGIDFLEVADDGAGIPTEDIPNTIKKYSTSKISSLKDLQEVMTFWFRGEALASIASVSEFTLISQSHNNSNATQLLLGKDRQSHLSQTVREQGTTVRVENLFFNTPARLNYLKTPRTEFLKVQDIIEHMALSYPEIAFTLSHNQKTVLQFPKNQGILARMYDVFWSEVADNAVAVEYTAGGVHISGYITDPKVSFSNKTRQALFLNHRIIRSPIIYKAIIDGYNRFISPKTFPWYVLYIDVDPTSVDVNVHPRKMEVRFSQEQLMFRSIYHSIKDTLEAVSFASMTPQKTHLPTTSSPHMNLSSQSPGSQHIKNTSSSTYHTSSGAKFKNYSPYTSTKPHPAQVGLDFTTSILHNTSSQDIFSTDLHDTPLGKIIGQLHNAYIVLQTPTGMQILDQHALAERVLYEKISSSATPSTSQKILGGIGIHLTTKEKNILENTLEIFEDMWFEIDILSGENIMIQAIPDFMNKKNIQEIFPRILADISSVGSSVLEEVRNTVWAYTACRSAVKFWDPLSIFEMHGLLKDASIEYSDTCPHGRPVVYDIDLDWLKKKYERT